jgi:hypothetical protein
VPKTIVTIWWEGVYKNRVAGSCATAKLWKSATLIESLNGSMKLKEV